MMKPNAELPIEQLCPHCANLTATEMSFNEQLKHQLDAERGRVAYLSELLSSGLDVKKIVDFNAPEDEMIGNLCEQIGYGAVMHSAGKLWYRRYGGSAHSTGHCVAVIEKALEEASAADWLAGVKAEARADERELMRVRLKDFKAKFCQESQEAQNLMSHLIEYVSTGRV